MAGGKGGPKTTVRIVLRYRVPSQVQQEFFTRIADLAARLRGAEGPQGTATSVVISLLQPVFSSDPVVCEVHFEFPSLAIAGRWIDRFQLSTAPRSAMWDESEAHVLDALRAPLPGVELISSDATSVYRSFEFGSNAHARKSAGNNSGLS